MQKSTENVAKSPKRLPQVPKWSFLRMRSKSVADNGRKCD